MPPWYLPLTRRRPNGIPSTVTGAQYNLSRIRELNAGAESIRTRRDEGIEFVFSLSPPALLPLRLSHHEIYSATLYGSVVR